MRKFLILFSGFAFSLAGPAFAAEISLGLGVGWQSSPYKGHDDTLLPVPLVGIEGEHFYLRGLEAGAYVYKTASQSLSLGLSYGGPHFDSDDTDDARLKRLSDRKTPLNAHLKYSLSAVFGDAGLSVMHDVSGHSQAMSAELYYKYPFSFGAFYLIPGAGLAWDSQEQLEYYYGVSAREAGRSGLEEYAPQDGFSPFISLELDWPISERWSFTAAEKVLFLSDEIQDSPMIDDGQVFNAFVGLRYTL